MQPPSTWGVGGTLGAPDICLTPAPPGAPVGIAYLNDGENVLAAPFSPIVKISMAPGLTEGSEITLTMGDEAGLAHPTIKGVARFVKGDLIVYIDGLPAIKLFTAATANNANDGLAAVVKPSPSNVLFCQVAPGSLGADGQAPIHRPMPHAEVDALLRSVAGPGRSGEPALRGAMLPDGIGYLGIRVFSAEAPALAYDAIRRLSRQGMRALVVDLRDNPGGVMTAAIEIAGDFLELGSAIVTVRDADGDEIVHRSRHESPHRFPVVALVNRRTASAAELFAGCLKAHRRATVVGETTYGKGVAQKIVRAPDGGAVYAVVASFTPPDHHELQGKGICPDIELPDGAAAEEANAHREPARLDPGLRAAAVIASRLLH